MATMLGFRARPFFCVTHTHTPHRSNRMEIAIDTVWYIVGTSRLASKSRTLSDIVSHYFAHSLISAQKCHIELSHFLRSFYRLFSHSFSFSFFEHVQNRAFIDRIIWILNAQHMLNCGSRLPSTTHTHAYIFAYRRSEMLQMCNL